MDPFGVLVFAVVLFLFLGGFGLAFAVVLLGGSRTARGDANETIEANAERLHEMIRPDEGAADD
jgi:hypothetical protein